MPHRKGTLFFLIFAGMKQFFLLLAPFWCLLTFAAPKHEVRAVWLTTFGGLDWPRAKANTEAGRQAQQQELRDILDRLQQDGINTIYLQTRIRGAVIYPSAIEPWDGALTGRYDRHPGYDPLQFAIEECHRRGMECHAWMVAIPAFKVGDAKALGRKSLIYTHPKLLYRHNGSYYLDPSLPGTADYLESLCREVARNYDIDGIHFDYIRYPEKTARTREDWRRENITRIVRQLYGAIKEEKPWIKVSCSPVGKYRDVSRYSARGWNAYHAVYQDAVLWMQEGIMDMISPMMYFRGNHFFPFAADWQEQSHGRVIAPGLGIYFLDPGEKDWDLSEVTRELRFIRQQGMGGAAYFRTRFLLDDVKGLETWLRHHYYTTTALTPPLKNAHTYPTSLRRTPRYVLYASDTYPVDTSAPENIVRVFWGEVKYNMLAARLFGKHLAVTTLDDYGNESAPVDIEE